MTDEEYLGGHYSARDEADNSVLGQKTILQHKKELNLSSEIADKSVIQCLGFSGFGTTSNPCRVDVKDGKVVRIRPLRYTENYTKEDLNYWTLEKDGHVFEPLMKTLSTPFSLSYKNRTYSKNRVPYPLIRVDWDPHGERNVKNRGKSKYRRISWDEATDIIAEEIKRIQETYGPYSVYCQGEGHGETKNYNGSHGCMIAMLNYTGGCTPQARQPDSWEGWYWGAKHVWGMEPIGVNNQCNGIINDITKNSDALLYWGADPETTPWGWGGQQASRLCYWFSEIGVKSIFICPDLNYAGGIHADKWIPVLPNTDAAMQFAIAYTWITEDTYDKEYIAEHTVGFDWLESYVLGYIDGIAKTPKWAEEKCGVKSYHIKAFARYWAKHNVSIAHCNGGGYIRSAFSHEPARMEICLLAMQAVGKPGRNQFRFIEFLLFGMDKFNPLPRSEIFTNLHSAFHGWDFTLGNSFIAKTLLPNAILSGKEDWYGRVLCGMPREDQFNHFEYPIKSAERIHMIWSDTPCWSACWNNGFKFKEALRDESIEFVLVQHPWMENDTLSADIILPASTMLECYDIGNDNINGQFSILYIEEQAIEPVGEALSDFHIVCEVAKKLEKLGGNYEDLLNKYTEGMTQEEKMQLGFNSCGKPKDLTWEKFKEQDFWMSPTREGWEEEPAGLINFAENPDNNLLETPSGKIEIYSTALAKNFPDDKIRAPYPQWIEEGDGHQERICSKRAEKYPFLLMSNHPRWRVHVQHDDIPWLREIETCKVKGPDGYLYEPLWINPKNAEELDIRNGDIVTLFNERGRVLGGAYVTERIMPGALYQDHGARIDLITSGEDGLDRGGSNNLISPTNTTSKNCAGEVTNGFLVGIEKADVFALAAKYPEEFNRNYDAGAGLVASAYIEEEN
jgi:trimethylamine-N-oxide reductase (cytochrome c)